jgi:group I intron endonuclease
MFCTYKITCVGNDKNYYGSSNDFSRRKSQHLSYLRKNTHINKHLQNAYNKYGEDSFVFIMLESFETRDEMKHAEQELLDSYLNISFNKSSSAESPQLFGIDNGFFGRKHNEETKLKMRKAKEGKCNWTKNSIVITDKGIFGSIALACKYHEIQRSTYHRRVKRNTNTWIVI